MVKRDLKSVFSKKKLEIVWASHLPAKIFFSHGYTGKVGPGPRTQDKFFKILHWPEEELSQNAAFCVRTKIGNHFYRVYIFNFFLVNFKFNFPLSMIFCWNFKKNFTYFLFNSGIFILSTFYFSGGKKNHAESPDQEKLHSNHFSFKPTSRYAYKIHLNKKRVHLLIFFHL